MMDTEKKLLSQVEILSELKQAKEKLKDNEKMLNLFFNQSLSGAFFMMLDEPIIWNDSIDKEEALDYFFSHGRITKANQIILDQYRVTEDSFLGLSPNDFFKHDLKQGRDLVRSLFDQGNGHIETDERRSDGTQMWVEGDYICMYDSQGRITGHFGIQNDITDRKQAEVELKMLNESLNFQLQFEKMVSDISTYFISLPPDQLDLGINNALKKTGEFFQVDRSYVFQFSLDHQTISNTHSWCAEGIDSQVDKIKGFPVSKIIWWVERIIIDGYLYIPDVDSLDPEAKVERKELQAHGIKSLLYLPIIKDGNIFGFFGLDSVKEKKIWTKESITLLKLLVEIISNAFARYKADEEIRHLSFHDSLTNLYNRAYLEEELKRLDTKRQLPISIIMADLNGLKLVNDTYGHNAGDRMLKNAAEILSISCRKEDIIARWGGDEFLILLPQTSQKETEIICKRINSKCEKSFVEGVPISIALGVATKTSQETSIQSTIKTADDNMYKHKLTKSRSTRSTLLKALLNTLATKSFETEEHALRMLTTAHRLGEKKGLSDQELDELSLIVTLHDIGKISIPEEILTKKEALTPQEWEIIKNHPETGFRLIQSIEEFAHVANEILCHHQRWDGTGYPNGLREKQIPLLARITSIADAYEVMSNGRPYKKAISKEEIIEEFKRCAGTQFDPELAELFLEILEEEKGQNLTVVDKRISKNTG